MKLKVVNDTEFPDQTNVYDEHDQKIGCITEVTTDWRADVPGAWLEATVKVMRPIFDILVTTPSGQRVRIEASGRTPPRFTDVDTGADLRFDRVRLVIDRSTLALLDEPVE